MKSAAKQSKPQPDITGNIFCSRVVYNCNLQKPDSEVIPLGVVVEVKLSMGEHDLRVVGMIGQPTLSYEEQKKIGNLAQQKLQNPYLLLKSEVDAAWHEQPNGVLEHLARSNAYSFEVSYPETMALPASWKNLGPRELEETVSKFVSEMLDEKFAKIFAGENNEHSRNIESSGKFIEKRAA